MFRELGEVAPKDTMLSAFQQRPLFAFSFPPPYNRWGKGWLSFNWHLHDGFFAARLTIMVLSHFAGMHSNQNGGQPYLKRFPAPCPGLEKRQRLC